MPGRRGGASRDRGAAPDPEAALEIAARYLGARPRSRWEVARRLRRAGVDDEMAGATLDRLAQLGYVDDLAFARWWAEQRDRHAPRGRRRIEAELRQRGVAREVIEALRDEAGQPGPPNADEPAPQSDEDRARKALAAHLGGRPMPSEPRDRQRLAAFLARRGFDADTVWAVLRAESEDR